MYKYIYFLTTVGGPKRLRLPAHTSRAAVKERNIHYLKGTIINSVFKVKYNI